MYNVSSGEIWFTDDDVDKRRDSKDIFYVHNVFTKLNDIYLKKQNSYYEFDLHDDLAVPAVGKFLRKQADYYQSNKMGGVNTSGLIPHFCIFFPRFKSRS